MDIKFRVWDGKKMWYPPKKEDYTWRLARTGKLWRCTAFYDTTIEHNTSGKGMLSTGLSDRNGKVIYEGDLYRVKPDADLGVVTWRGKSAAFHLAFEKCHPFLTRVMYFGSDKKTTGVGEVMGNIYENPDYDLSAGKRIAAVKQGAKEVPDSAIKRLLRKVREAYDGS